MPQVRETQGRGKTETLDYFCSHTQGRAGQVSGGVRHFSTPGVTREYEGVRTKKEKYILCISSPVRQLALGWRFPKLCLSLSGLLLSLNPMWKLLPLRLINACTPWEPVSGTFFLLTFTCSLHYKFFCLYLEHDRVPKVKLPCIFSIKKLWGY